MAKEGLMKRFLMGLMLFTSSAYATTTYYVNPAGTNLVQDGSQANPWHTMAQANTGVGLDDTGDILVLVAPGTIINFPSPAVGGSTAHRYYFIAADASWNQDRSHPAQHILTTGAGNFPGGTTATVARYITVAGFTSTYGVTFPIGATHDSLCDCILVNDGIYVYNADSSTVSRCTVNTGDLDIMHAGGTIGTWQYGFSMYNCNFQNMSSAPCASGHPFVMGEERQPTLLKGTVNTLFRQCTFTINVPDCAAASDPQAIRLYYCPRTTFDGCYLYIHQNNHVTGESSYPIALRDSSYYVMINRDSIYMDGQGGQTIYLGHGGGSNHGTKYLTIDSTYISNTNATLMVDNNFGLDNFTATYSTFVATNSSNVLYCAIASSGPNDIEHCTFIGYGGHGPTAYGLVTVGRGVPVQTDTTKFYSNILVNYYPAGGNSDTKYIDTNGSTLSNMFIDKTTDTNDLWHSGFNTTWNLAYTMAQGSGQRADLYWCNACFSTTGAKASAPGLITTGANANNFRLDYQTANRVYGDAWSTFTDPHLASGDSLENGTLVLMPTHFDPTPICASPANNTGKGRTDAGAVACACPGNLHVVPRNAGDVTDTTRTIYLNYQASGVFSDSIIVANRDSSVVGLSRIEIADLSFSSNGVPSYDGAMTFEPNPIALGVGDTVKVKITYTSPYPTPVTGGNHAYILITPRDALSPRRVVLFDFGSGHNYP
jgi:hypothetical protein